MAFSENVEAQIIGTIIGGVILLAPAAILAGAAPLLGDLVGEHGTHYLELVLGSATLLFTLIAGDYYFFVLPGGNEAPGSDERKRYDALRSDLADGGTAVRIYSEKLTATLKAVERFFRDKGSPGQRAFGMTIPAPLWTAEAFHCCLILALAYSQVMIFLIWAVSGDVGPAEAALGLPQDLPTWQRVASFIAFLVSVFAYWKSHRVGGWLAPAWLTVTIVFGIIVAVNLASGTADVAGAISVTGAVVAVVNGDIAIALAGAGIGALIGAVALAFGGIVVGTVAGFLTVLGVGFVASATNISITRGHRGVIWLLYLVGTIAACLLGVGLLSPLDSWPVVGPLLLFVGLVTLLNAPFSWFSLGLTRALLWRGLERQMWWPYFYALVDAICAVFVIAFLTCVLVMGIQAFDFIASRSGGSQILPLDQVFRGLVADGLAPKYWWLYALFLSTMIPSLVNLAIGGLSLTRGIPRLSAYLHRLMETRGSVLEFHRVQIAVLLATQFVLGVALGIAAQAVLIFVLVRYAMPTFGVGLLEIAQAVAAFDLPGKISGLF